MNTDRRNTWDIYARAWKERTPEAKALALQKSVVTDCVYSDPNIIAHGHGELIEYMLAFHQQVPGGYFVTTYFLTHHDAAIARWNMLSGDDAVIGDGISYARYNEGGALIAMTGFFEIPGAE